MEPATATLLAAGITAAASAASTAMTNNTSSKTSSNISNSALLQSIYNQMNQSSYNAEALKRSTAGYSDSTGTTQTYDPYTNTWNTQLGPTAQAEALASGQASVARDTTDLRQAEAANTAATGRSLSATDATDSALRAIQNYNTITPQSLTGDLIEQATTANRNAETPVIADTVRQYARQGTAAGPVLANLQRQSADSLRSAIIDSTIKGYQTAGSLNSTNQKNLTDKYTTVAAGSVPTFQYPGIATDSTSNTMAQLAAYRAGQSTNAASTAGKDVTDSTNANTTAASNAAKNVSSSNYNASQLSNYGKTLASLFSSGNVDAWNKVFGSDSSSKKVSYGSDGGTSFGQTTSYVDPNS